MMFSAIKNRTLLTRVTVAVAAVGFYLALSYSLATLPANWDIRPFSLPLKNVSGISFDGLSLWITVEGERTIYQVNSDTSRIVRKLAFAVKETGGSAWDGRHLWQLAYVEKKIYKIDVTTGEILHVLRSPGNGMCSGMTFDGEYLWVANFEDKKIYQIDQNRNGKIVNLVDGYFEATGLAWDGRYLWNGILVGTETHDEETPYTGFVQQRALNSRVPLAVVPIPGVGPGTSNWTPGDRQPATRFWWYDGFHKKIVAVNLETRSRATIRLLGLAFCIVSLLATAAVRGD